MSQLQHNLPFPPSNLYSHFRPTPVIPGIPVNFLKAAELAVHAQQYVLTLSARKSPSPNIDERPINM
jgi:hypothetical protein